ncbi:MAG: hypothetical protein ACFE8J_10205 [Candidatus Heimdallarchaeota archaeon]
MLKTFDQMCLDKLKEIGKASAREWAEAMGYTSPNALAKVIKRIKKEMPDKIIVFGKTPRRYEAI